MDAEAGNHMNEIDFKVLDGKFLLNGKPKQLISGEIHYFRILPELWLDRLEKMKLMGLDAVQTYLAWNIHEPNEGDFNFTGIADFEKFVSLAGELGLMVIVRPGPYICSEWEFGGLPAWLLNKPGIKLRCMNKPYLEAVRRYFDQVMPRLKKLQCSAGGPIIAMQVENEYGSYGNDHEYIKHLHNLFLFHGIDVLLFTSDGPSDRNIPAGTIPGLLMTLNFGSKPEVAFKKGREYRPNGPDFCMEYWNAWGDHWGEKHHTRDSIENCQNLDYMLSVGASATIYMAHGGTSFGFMNGANDYCDGKYLPYINSYDFDAPVNECGDATDKFYAYREIISKYKNGVSRDKPAPTRKIKYGNVALEQSVAVLDSVDTLARKHLSVEPETMEYFGQNYGFIHYRTRVSGNLVEQKLLFLGVHDRAQVFLDKKPIGSLNRGDANKALTISTPPEGAQLDVLVENMGRVNYGPMLRHEKKGLLDGVCLGYQHLFNWETWCLPMENLSKLKFGPLENNEDIPAYHRGHFTANEQADTFLKVPGKKGVCWINGFNLGRYWEIGPQRTLYVPAPLIRKGRNEIIILELHRLDDLYVELTDNHELG
jgi:beta-galactosidase